MANIFHGTVPVASQQKYSASFPYDAIDTSLHTLMLCWLQWKISTAVTLEL